MRRLAVLALSPLLALGACTKDGNETGGEAGTSGDSESSDSESVGTSGEGTDSGSTSDSGGVPENEPARGIQIVRVEANSGSAIAVVADGAWVEGAQRTAQIPKNRNTAFRIYVDVDDDAWVDRDIEGRFTVSQEDGSENVYKETITVGGDSSMTSLQSNFLFGVLAEDMQPGAKFQVELYEASPDYTSLPEVDGPPTAVDSPAFIGIETGYQNMKVVIVPVNYSFGGCTANFDTSEETLDRYRREMFQQNPLENIEISVHEPLVVSDLDLTAGNGFYGLLNRASQLRASEQPAPNVYYYALFDNCGDCIGTGGGSSSGCLLGVAPGTPGDSMGEASQRVAIGVQYLGGSEVGMETFVHEIGHTQGRSHVVCPGTNAAGADITYPHADGKIGVWGFGVEDFEIRNATTHTDYMSYCNPTWVSDWQWRATFERIRVLSGWDELGRIPEMEGSAQLVGHINPETGESSWFTDRGGVDPDQRTDPQWAVDFNAGGEAIDHQLVDVDAWSEGPWITVRAPLTERFTEVTSVALQGPSLQVDVDARDIVQYHGKGLATP